MKSLFGVGVLRLPICAALSALVLNACGLEEPKVEKRTRLHDGQGGNSTAETPRLAERDTDQVVGTLVIPFGQDDFALTADGTTKRWTVDMEVREDVKAGVAPLKYLKVKGELAMPADAPNEVIDLGCLFVELKDNVYYREQTWLRLATTGVYGSKYQDVMAPLIVDLGGMKDVPKLEGSLTMQEFAGNTIKKFDGTLCFKLDLTNAPAQTYEGEIIVQYLRPGDTANPPACAMNTTSSDCAPKSDPMPPTPPPAEPQFACLSMPAVLKAKQSVTLNWTPGDYNLEVKLATDDPTYTGQLGAVMVTGKGVATYTAPDRVTKNVRVLATARRLGTESLPAFCEINLIGDEDICIKDDGEVNGVVGNVFMLPPNTQKLPNLDAMTPIASVAVGNFDIPQRSFSAGFPGVRDVFEWFAIRFKGRINIPAAGQCSFKLTSDDGANLYIDGNKVVDNDGVHPTQSKTGNAQLSKGWHDIRVDYYQGPRYHITLQLAWQCGTATGYQIIPVSAFARPLQ